MINFTPLTEEMIENTKSFYEYCIEHKWKLAIEKRMMFFNWFYDPTHVSIKQKTDVTQLTLSEIEYIDEAVRKSFYEAFGAKAYYDWFVDELRVNWINKPKNFIIVGGEES